MSQALLLRSLDFHEHNFHDSLVAGNEAAGEEEMQNRMENVWRPLNSSNNSCNQFCYLCGLEHY